MIENIKSISNPLTIIAIFAALAEIAGTVALGIVDTSHQGTFIWFVMGFPILLVVLFFITLNFNSRALYAPSDFKDESNFLKTLEKSLDNRELVKSFDEILAQLDQVKGQILEQARLEVGTAGEREQAKLTLLLETRLAQIVESNIAPVQQRLERGRESAAELSFDSLEHDLTQDHAWMLEVLYKSGRELTTKELATQLSTNTARILEIAGLLRAKGFLVTQLTLFETEGDPPGASQTHGLTNRGRYFVRSRQRSRRAA